MIRFNILTPGIEKMNYQQVIGNDAATFIAAGKKTPSGAATA
nr:hypothetical protein [Mixta theicola]